MHCPFCGHDNLDGAESCESCHQDLTVVERMLEPKGRLRGAILGTLEDVGILEALVVAPSDSVAAAVDLMRKRRHGSVLVMEGEKLQGIFTEHDLYHRVPIDKDLATLPIVEVMTPGPHCYAPGDTVAMALHSMAVRVRRHLPIVEEGRVRGFVSVRKVLAHIRQKAGL